MKQKQKSHKKAAYENLQKLKERINVPFDKSDQKDDKADFENFLNKLLFRKH